MQVLMAGVVLGEGDSERERWDKHDSERGLKKDTTDKTGSFRGKAESCFYFSVVMG